MILITIPELTKCFSLQTDEGEDDLKKGTQLLEIYALEIQMYTAQKNNKKLKVSGFCSENDLVFQFFG